MMHGYTHYITTPIKRDAIYPALLAMHIDVGTPEEFESVFSQAFMVFNPFNTESRIATFACENVETVRPVTGRSNTYSVHVLRDEDDEHFDFSIKFCAHPIDACHDAALRLSRRLPNQVIRAHAEDLHGSVGSLHYFQNGLCLTRPIDSDPSSRTPWRSVPDTAQTKAEK